MRMSASNDRERAAADVLWDRLKMVTTIAEGGYEGLLFIAREMLAAVDRVPDE